MPISGRAEARVLASQTMSALPAQDSDMDAVGC